MPYYGYLIIGGGMTVDAAVHGIREMDPNVELALQAGFEIQNGIVVDELLRSSHSDIYAAEDVAAFIQSVTWKTHIGGPTGTVTGT